MNLIDENLAQTENGPWSRRDCLLAGVGAMLLGTTGATVAQPVSAAAEEAKAPPLPTVGSLLQVPTVTLLDNTVYAPASSEGQYLLVYWWSSTCPFCALQSPSMEKLWQAQRGKGLQMLALSVDRKPEHASAYLQQKGYTFPAAWTSPAWRKAFPKPKGLPITLLRGRDGRVLMAEKGQLFPEDVEAIAERLV